MYYYLKSRHYIQYRLKMKKFGNKLEIKKYQKNRDQKVWKQVRDQTSMETNERWSSRFIIKYNIRDWPKTTIYTPLKPILGYRLLKKLTEMYRYQYTYTIPFWMPLKFQCFVQYVIIKLIKLQPIHTSTIAWFSKARLGLDEKMHVHTACLALILAHFLASALINYAIILLVRVVRNGNGDCDSLFPVFSDKFYTARR